MDYSKPLDAALFPKGVERCSLTQFSMWMCVPIWHLMFGFVAGYVIFANGLGTTALDNRFGFGLWITVDLAIIALGAGAFFTGLLRYILNIDELKTIVNFTAALGFLCYTSAMVVLVLDIGQPLRSWFGFWYPNVHSMLTEVIFCISCYCVVLTIEYVSLILDSDAFKKKKAIQHLAHNFHVYMPLFAGIGAFLSTFHQGSLGGMYGVLFGRPYAFREGFFVWPWTFFLFLLSAVSAGPMFSVLVATIIEKFTGRKLVSWKVKQLLAKMGATMLVIYTFFKFIDSYVWINSLLPKTGNVFSDMFYGFIYSDFWFFTEHVVLVIAILFLAIPTLRQRPFFFYTGLLLTCYSVCLNRYVMTVQTLGIPVLPFETWEYYWPSWTEWGAFAFIVGYTVLSLSLTYRYTPLFPEEVELNKKVSR